MGSNDAKIIIAGAGLGGLTAAGCLLLAGFDVEVYEQAPELGEIGAGVQQSANATHVMRHLGVLDALRDVAYLPPVTEFRLFDSGEVLQVLSLAENHEARHGAPYLQMHRADFHRILAERVMALKADAIHLGATAVGFEESASHVALLLSDGRRIEGDVLIGADGIKSAVRRQIAGPATPDYTGDAAWRLTVPVDRFAADFMEGKSSIWVGPDKHAVVYFLRGGALLNFVACTELDEWIEESWTLKRPWRELKADFDGWHEDIHAIIDAADRDECYRWALNVYPALDNWSTSRATLIGDAAHPTLPYLAQGAAMAVEDAAVLTRALGEASSIDDAFQLYQRNRLERTGRIVREAYENRGLFHLETIEALRAAFAKRDMDRERSDWLYAYNPLTVDLV
ncbi:MAG: monooxygenase [Rhodospirillaceae bacterium]|nr:monooxygenase [Rhodospirillaceae bacterium]